MAIKTVVVCEAQVPFVHGGAEIHVRELLRELVARGYDAELVSVPFKWSPKSEILPHAAAWRLLDLSESNGRAIDLVIASKFPTYFVRHPRKVAWLIHQYRAAYELCGTVYSDFGHNEADVGLRDTLIRLDTEMLGECRRVFANAGNTAGRVQKFNGIAAEALPSTPAGGSQPGPYATTSSRSDGSNRSNGSSLLVRAMVASISRSAGCGRRRNAAGQSSSAWRTSRRRPIAWTFLGQVSDEQLIALYRDTLAVLYPPYDEDSATSRLEAFLARKPVVTAADSGGPTEFVADGVNGFVRAPEPDAFADAINRLAADRGLAASMGDAGYERARTITWDGVIEKLVS
jgi:glycosyltransferase involved in cell wall biosynthesis